MKKKILALAMAITLILGFQGVSVLAKKQTAKGSSRPIAVQGAMDMEVSALLKEMGKYKEENYGNYTFYRGKINGIPVIVSRTEVGMVNAATSTTLLIEKYHPKAIINQGTAGGHDPNLHVFDTVIGTEVMNIGKYTTEHLDDGQGMKPESWSFDKTEMRENSKIEKYASFKSDSKLVKVALSVANKYKHGKVVKGKVGSADVWNREVDRIQWFHEKVGTSVEEMEAASVGQVAKSFDVPYLSIRTVSNSEVSGDKVEDLETAGKYGAKFAVEVVKALGKGCGAKNIR
jgi:adenosylhomocysteine nucleosidase